MGPRIILTQSVTGHYSYNLRASDGQLLLTSPCFTDRDTAISRINSTRALARRDGNYEVYSAGGGRYYFELKDNKWEMLGASTIYSDEQSVQKGIYSLKCCAKASKLLDMTIPE
jgi:uncharacterized protein YegP (UPF0339 family)